MKRKNGDARSQAVSRYTRRDNPPLFRTVSGKSQDGLIDGKSPRENERTWNAHENKQNETVI